VSSFSPPSQNYWEESYRSRGHSFASDDDPVSKWLLELIPSGTGECLEVGICPGRYSRVISSKGYVISGIDSSPTISDVKNALVLSGIRVNEMICGDFLGYKFFRKFDLVVGLGFIEHFAAWKHVIAKMASLVCPGGYFVCEVPNFSSPIQLSLRQELDRQNLARHNLDSMDLIAWSDILTKAGFTVCQQGPFGEFDFWVDNEPRNENQLELLRNVLFVTRFLKFHLNCSDISYSPYIGMIARRD